MQSPTPTMPFQPGRSSPSTKPRTIPQTGAVVKTRPVLAALVRLMPNVKAVWAAPMPKQPRPTMGRRSLRRSLLSGSRVRSTRRSKRPPPINRNATIKSWGRKSAAYFVAAKFMPQKKAAKIRATSVSAAALPFSSLTTRFYARSTLNAPSGELGATSKYEHREARTRGRESEDVRESGLRGVGHHGQTDGPQPHGGRLRSHHLQ